VLDMEVLTSKELKAYYHTMLFGVKRTVKAVDGVTLSVNENEILGIAGESGCGKSTLLKVLVGLVKPPLNVVGGEVIYRTAEREVNPYKISKDALDKIRWKFVSYVPQGSMHVLNPTRKIVHTFTDVMNAHKNGMITNNPRIVIERHINSLGLPFEVLNSYPHQLSGGMRQRVSIALVTVLKPNLIIADEPTTALDVVVQRGVIQLLKRVQQEFRNSMIIVTHDMAVHANLTDRIAIMYVGKIVETGRTENIFKHPLHPYTRFLIASLPKLGDKEQKSSAPGYPPSLANPPSGCAFHPRCPHVMDICKSHNPELLGSGGQQVACFLYREVQKI